MFYKLNKTDHKIITKMKFTCKEMNKNYVYIPVGDGKGRKLHTS